MEAEVERKVNKITNCRQFDLLVALMEKNVSVARGYLNYGSTKDEYLAIWNGITDQLNSIGPPTRTNKEWQKVWNDYKAKIKQKLGHNKKELKATGGGCNKLFTFSALEESVIDILLLRKVVEPSRKTFGIVHASNPVASTSAATASTSAATPPVVSEDNQVIVEFMDISSQFDTLVGDEIHSGIDDALIQQPSCSNISQLEKANQQQIPHSSNKSQKKSFGDERKRLLEIQTEAIQKTEKHARETARYTRKLFELKEKKLKIYKENLLEERKMRAQQLELKLRAIECKERELALREKNY